MKPAALSTLLATAFRNRLKVLIVSSPGIGKTSIAMAAIKEALAEMVSMHPAVSDPTDFKGMPAIVQLSGKGANGKPQTVAEFLPFGNLRILVNATKLTICLIDDIGQAPHAVQAALMQLIQAREVDGQKISDHVVFVGATNDSSHMAGVSSILEPVKSRWDTIVTLDVGHADWVKWAVGEGDMPPELVAFIRFRPALLNDFKPTRDLTNSPSPRTVEAVGKWLKAGVEDHEVLAGAAGQGFAIEFAAFLLVWKSLPDIDYLIANPASAPLPNLAEPSLAFALVSALAYKSTAKNLANIIAYTDRIPKEYQFLFVRDATTRDTTLYSTKAYTDWTIQNHSFMA